MPSVSVNLLVPVILAAGIAGLVTGAMVPFVAQLALAVRALDYPGERKDQEAAVPRLGGLAIAFGLGV